MSQASVQLSHAHASEGSVKDPAKLKVLKHELRTPINHIIGFSELLAEAASDDGQLKLSEKAMRLHSIGHALAHLVETKLSASPEALASRAINELFDSLKPLVAEILSGISEDLTADPSPYSRDLDLIRAAALRLLDTLPQSLDLIA